MSSSSSSKKVGKKAPPPSAHGHRLLPQYEIDLDLPPSQRYEPLFQDTATNLNATVWQFYRQYFEHDAVLKDVLYEISKKRGPENEEQQQEVDGLVERSRLPREFVQAVQMIYELQTLMVPVINGTKHHKQVDVIPEEYAALKRIPWRGPGCTGIVAMCADGNVYHARNLDFSPLDIMKNLVYVAVFTRGGKEVFRSQMAAGYTSVITAYKAGADGFTVERNTRFTDHLGGNEQTIQHLISGRPLNGWSLRKIAETHDSFDDVVKTISDTPYCSPEYNILSGVGKGKVLSKDPDRVAHVQTLGHPGVGENKRGDYVIMTNFDFYWGDIREYFDPTAGGVGKKTRREAAEANLARWPVGKLTPDALFETINAPYVLAKDTVFQMLTSVSANSWNASQPILQ